MIATSTEPAVDKLILTKCVEQVVEECAIIYLGLSLTTDKDSATR
jgi:hypothetical protein